MAAPALGVDLEHINCSFNTEQRAGFDPFEPNPNTVDISDLHCKQLHGTYFALSDKDIDSHLDSEKCSENAALSPSLLLW